MCLCTYLCAHSCIAEYGRDSTNEFDVSTPTSNEKAEGGGGGEGGGGLEKKKAPEPLDLLHSSQVLKEVPESTRNYDV